jgi:hypothetical protein
MANRLKLDNNGQCIYKTVSYQEHYIHFTDGRQDEAKVKKNTPALD